MSRFRQFTVPMETQVEFHGDHTTVAYAILTLPDGQRLFTGVAKRNPVDKHDPDVGASIALGRAISAAGRYLTRQGDGLVKHHDDMRKRNVERSEREHDEASKNLQRAVSETAAEPNGKFPKAAKKVAPRVAFGVSTR